MQVDSGKYAQFFVALSVWGMHLNKTITQYFKKFLLGKIKQEKNRKPE